MSIIICEKSDNLKLLDNINNDKINLIYQFYLNNDTIRKNEIKECLYNNVKNKYIDNIYLLNEKIYSNEELGIESEKIKQININKRCSYKDIYEFVLNNNINGYILFINSDIFFDESINVIKYSNIHLEKTMISLLRYEYTNKDLKKCKLFYDGREDSQDTWIFHSNFKVKKKYLKAFDFNFGVPGCDNKILYLMNILNYKIINDPLLIKTYHNHKSQYRNYSKPLHFPHYKIVPYNINIDYIKSKNDTGLKFISEISKNLSIFNTNDNKNLYEYIKRKNLLKENFIIPTISGIETNFSIHGVMTDTYDENVNKYLKENIKVMKTERGIKLKNIDSIKKYSNMYLKAFENCDIYGDWEKWSPKSIYNSDIIKNKYQKLYFSINVFGIFQYIHDNSWILSLKNKKILLISNNIDNINKNIHNRNKIYDIDIFPGCEFIINKPPQTYNKDKSEDFIIEINNYFNKINDLIQEFDIALVDSAGYGNIICNYIYEKGKSSINIGEILQIYFGVYDNKLEKEYIDIFNLYKNEYWYKYE